MNEQQETDAFLHSLREYGIFLGFQTFMIRITLANACGRPLTPLIINPSLARLLTADQPIQIDNPLHRHYDQWERLLQFANEMDMHVDWVRTIDEAKHLDCMVAIRYATRKELFYRRLRKFLQRWNSVRRLQPA